MYVYEYIYRYIFTGHFFPQRTKPPVSSGDFNAISLGQAREGCKPDSGAAKKGQSGEKIGCSRDFYGIYMDLMVIFMGFSVIFHRIYFLIV